MSAPPDLIIRADEKMWFYHLAKDKTRYTFRKTKKRALAVGLGQIAGFLAIHNWRLCIICEILHRSVK